MEAQNVYAQRQSQLSRQEKTERARKLRAVEQEKLAPALVDTGFTLGSLKRRLAEGGARVEDGGSRSLLLICEDCDLQIRFTELENGRLLVVEILTGLGLSENPLAEDAELVDEVLKQLPGYSLVPGSSGPTPIDPEEFFSLLREGEVRHAQTAPGYSYTH
jgi:hypothetical protein